MIGGGRRLLPQGARRLDDQRRHPRRRLRGRPPADDARDGEIVVAPDGEEATVKRFYSEPDHIRLQPENDDGPDHHHRGEGNRQSDGGLQEVRLRRTVRGLTCSGERSDAAGRKIASRKVRTPKGRAVGNAHPAKSAGQCHRNIRPMARPHVSRVQAKVKRCGKSAPASW